MVKSSNLTFSASNIKKAIEYREHKREELMKKSRFSILTLSEYVEWLKYCK